MRSLDSINPRFMKPSKFTGVSACFIFILALMSVPLADGAASDIPIVKNPIVILLCLIVIFHAILALLAAVCRWGWKTKYYGVSLLSIAGISFLATVPCAAVLLYGAGTYWVKACIAITYVGSHLVWCQKFSNVYKKIFDDKILRGILFEEEIDAVYYMRRGDTYLLEKHLWFTQTPEDKYYLIFMGLALLMIPLMGVIRPALSAPFVHIFLTVAMLPVSWLSIGLAFRGYLIFYHYPALIKNETGKEVYMDSASKHRTVGRSRKRPDSGTC